MSDDKTTEVRPPPDTLDETVHWLMRRGVAHTSFYVWEWSSGRWWTIGSERGRVPREVAQMKLEYHSRIAPPAEVENVE